MFEVSFIQPSQRVNLKKLVATDKKTGKGSLGKKFHLEEIYKNPELYAAYPRLKDIEIFSEDFDNPNIGGETETEDLNGIEIRLNYDLINLEPKEMKKTLVHEIQHVIQSYEDFATGGTAPAIKKQLRDNIKEAKKTLRTIPKGTSRYERIQKSIEELQNTATNTLNTFEEKYNLYWRLGGEQEAREVENRLYARDKLSPVIHTPDALIVFGGQEYSMASMAPPENKKAAVTVTGNEFGEYNDIKELRRKAIQYYKDHLQGKSVFNNELGRIDIDENGLIEFTASGRKKVESTSAQEQKLLLVKYLPQLIADAKEIRKADSIKERHKDDTFYYMKNSASIHGEVMPIHITLIKHNTRRIQFYNHSVDQTENAPVNSAEPVSSNEALGLPPVGASSNENISQTKFAGNGDLERMFAAAKPIADKQIQCK